MIAAAAFALLAVVHSVLGELSILRPLFRASWTTPIPRWAVETIVRFVWHLTSVAWLGLAAISLGVPVTTAVFAVALISGVAIVVMLPGHLAWPVFGLAAVASAAEAGWIGPQLKIGAAAVAAAVLAVLAGLHVYWAFGGHLVVDAVFPTVNGRKPVRRPGVLITLAVAVALLTAGALVTARLAGWSLPGLDYLVAAVAVVLGLRAVGDGRYVGFFKRERTSRFAELDDRVYTPLCVALCFGTSAALF